jgi:succinoglycan biosynthesis transport protein ExoP
MNLSHLLAVVRARWIVILLSLVVSMSVSLILLLVRPQVFISTASIILSIRPDPVTMIYGGGTPALVNTELEVLRSDRVAARVVRNLKLVDMADLRRQWESESAGGIGLDAWLSKLLQGGLEVSLARAGGNVILVSYTSTDAKFAAVVANAFVQAYMETSIELKIDPARQYSTFFTEQVKEAREVLEKAQTKLSKFQQDKGLLVTDERMDIETTRLAALSQELLAAQSARSDSVSREAQISRNANQTQEVMGSAAVTGMKSELLRAEARLAELTSRYGDNHPQVQEARTSVSDIKRKLDAETRNVTGSMSANVRIQSSKESEVKAQLEAQRQKVLQLREVRDEGAVLARDVENAQRTYDLLFNRASQTNLESQNRLSNATVLSPAVPSTVAAKTAKYILLGLLAGLGGGIALALLVEQQDKRLRTASDVIFDLGIPVVGMIPPPPDSKRWRDLLQRNKKRVISGRSKSSDGQQRGG